MKSLFSHFLKSYKYFLVDLFFIPAPFTLLLFITPFFGAFLYFMTYYDPLEVL